MAHESLVSLLNEEDPEYARHIGSDGFRVRIVNYTCKTGFNVLTAGQVGKMVLMSGYVTDASETMALLREGVFRCRACGTEVIQEQQEKQYTQPAECPSCGKRTGVNLITDKSKFTDFQTFSLAAKWADSREPTTPLSVHVEAKHDLAGIARDGQEVEVVGIIDVSRHGHSSLAFLPFIRANSIRVIQDTARIGKPSVSLSSEQDLESLLQQNPGLLGYGLSFLGRQVQTSSGRLDLLLATPDGAYLVVELKNTQASHDAVSQLQIYLSWAEEKYQTKVRGAIVARGFSDRLLDAVKGSRFHIRLVDVKDILDSEEQTL